MARSNKKHVMTEYRLTSRSLKDLNKIDTHTYDSCWKTKSIGLIRWFSRELRGGSFRLDTDCSRSRAGGGDRDAGYLYLLRTGRMFRGRGRSYNIICSSLHALYEDASKNFWKPSTRTYSGMRAAQLITSATVNEIDFIRFLSSRLFTHVIPTKTSVHYNI